MSGFELPDLGTRASQQERVIIHTGPVMLLWPFEAALGHKNVMSYVGKQDGVAV